MTPLFQRRHDKVVLPNLGRENGAFVVVIPAIENVLILAAGA